MKIDLTDRSAVVTGSTAGIGHAIARGLAGAGASVVLNGRHQPDVDQALVVPVDWACAERPWWHFRPLATYYEDQECSEKAGRAIGKFLRSLKSTNSQKLNVVAHSMGNRVLRSVGKSAGGQARWDMEALAQGKSLLEAAPKDLQSNENLFENIFFVSADIPETVFDESQTERTSSKRSTRSSRASPHWL